MATKNYTVTAPLVIAKNNEGGDVYLYRGAPVPDGQSEEWIARHVDGEMIAGPKDAEKTLADQAGPGVVVPPPTEPAARPRR